MRIIEEEQLDFDDVSIMPKRSSLNSRSEVNLFRTFKWYGKSGEQHELTCKPLMVANMGTVGTPKMAKFVVPRGYLIALEKHYDFETIANLYNDMMGLATSEKKDRNFYTDKIAVSIGLREKLATFKKLSKYFKINIINFDVPNGYCPKVIDRLVELRKMFPEAFIIVGTVVTGDIVTDLILRGANCVRCGICNGCFDGDMEVITKNGSIPIKDINIGDSVLTHTGEFKSVTNKFTFSNHKQLMTVNGIKCTPDHKFYVAKIEDLDKINDDNYQKYCIWVKAEDLAENKYKLLKIEQ